jgi:hypothetical protein
MAWGKRSHGVDDLVAQLNQNCTAETMCVMRSRIFGDAEAIKFSTALSRNTSLKTLLLNGHVLSDDAVSKFGAALATNQTLEHLAIGDETFGDEKLCCLIDGGLDRNSTITKMDLEYRTLGPVAAQKLGSMLRNPQTPPLKELLLARNQLATEASAFGVTHTLFNLDI